MFVNGGHLLFALLQTFLKVIDDLSGFFDLHLLSEARRFLSDQVGEVDGGLRVSSSQRHRDEINIAIR